RSVKPLRALLYGHHSETIHISRQSLVLFRNHVERGSAQVFAKNCLTRSRSRRTPVRWPGGRAASFCATLRVAQPRAEGRARLNCKSVSRARSPQTGTIQFAQQHRRERQMIDAGFEIIAYRRGVSPRISDSLHRSGEQELVALLLILLGYGGASINRN